MRRDLGLRLPWAPERDPRAREGGGAHRESPGGERGVREGSEDGRRRRPRTGERESAGEGVAGQNSAKMRNGMYLRAREDPAMLRVALASAFTLGRGGFSPAAVALGSGQRWGEKAGSARGFIGRVVRGNKEGKQGGARHLPNGAGDLPSGTRHGRAKEGNSGKKKGRKGTAADRWGR